MNWSPLMLPLPDGLPPVDVNVPSRPYRILVTSSRGWTDVQTIWRVLDMVVSPDSPDREIILEHGDCPDGGDRIAADWGRKYGATVIPHPARSHPTEDFGPWPYCGPRRNAFMVSRRPDICLAFIGPCTSPRCRIPGVHPSHGATGCALLAEQAGILVKRHYAWESSE